MVDISTYKNNSTPYIKVDQLTNIDFEKRKVVVLDEGEIKEFSNKDGTKNTRLIIGVSWNEQSYLLGINRMTAQQLCKDLGTDTKKWVGAVLQMNIIGGANPYISLVVWKKPGGE